MSDGFPEAGVAGGCEPLDMGSWDQTQVLFKNSKVLNHEAISPVPKTIFSINDSGTIGQPRAKE